MRGEEARMTGLERHDFLPVASEHGKVVGGNDQMLEDAVCEDAVGDFQAHSVARSKAVDVGERCEVGRAMAGDVDELSFARHERLQ